MSELPEQPENLLVNQHEKPVPLGNTWRDGHVFFVLSGPSLSLIPPEELQQRGIVTLAVNNAATVIRPNFWVYGDRTNKFHDVIWKDPGIMKFMPIRAWHPRRISTVRTKVDGKFVDTGKQGRYFPGVIGYQRNAFFNPEIFLWEPTVNWGNSKKSAAQNNLPHIINIMFVAFRVAYYLGFRHIYLLGCDFNMKGARPYAFDQAKTPDSVSSNNGTYLKLNYMLSLLKPYFDNAKLEVFNCTPDSGLLAFPQLSFQEALQNAKSDLPKVIDTAGWYDD